MQQQHSLQPPRPASQPPSAAASPAAAAASSHSVAAPQSAARVHVIYDHASLSLPSDLPVAAFLHRLAAFSRGFGPLAEFSLALQAGAALQPQDKQAAHELGVSIEEASSDSYLLTRMLRLTLELQSAAAPASVVVASDHASLASSLALMRGSPLLANLVLVHSQNAAPELIAAAAGASVTVHDVMTASTPSSLHAQHPSAINTSLVAPRVCVSSPPGFSGFHRPAQLATSPLDDGSSLSLLGLHPALTSSPAHALSPAHGLSSLAPSPIQALLPTPPHGTVAALSPMRYLSVSNAPSPSHLRTRSRDQFVANSAPSSPTHRSFFPAGSQTTTHSPAHHQLSAHAGFFHQRSGSDRAQQFHSSSSSQARMRACVSSYGRIIAYCETEKLIPRESVLKKRLVDSKPVSAEGGGVEFEEFLAAVIQSGAGIMEGEAPQRIVWPRGPDGQPRKFACADFFTPVSRLSAEQNAELLEFLYAVQPEVERGRFGMATYLASHGPPFVRLLAHGVLVELVQLLLNRKVLLFRKGRVSVASRNEANEAASLGMLFSAADFHTPAISRVPSPTLAMQPPSRAVSPLTGMDAGIWQEKSTDEWHSGPSAAHIDRTLLHPGSRGGQQQPLQPAKMSMLHRSSLSSPLYAASPSAGFHATSYSTPVTRASSPTRSPPSQSGIDSSNMLRVRGGEERARGAYDFSQRKESSAGLGKALSSLQPLPPHPRNSYDSTVAAFEGTHLSANADEFKPSAAWNKDERFGSVPSSAYSGSVPSSAYSSRRSSLSDVNDWKNHATFESSGFVGESIDACDPAAVLAVKLAQLNQEAITASSIASGADELARFTAAVQYRPCFHFEKSGAAHTPEWVCVVSFCLGRAKYTHRSATHSKKDLAKNEVCMSVLQMIEENSPQLAAHLDQPCDTPDSVVDLARLLNFLQQAPVVYYLTRSQSVGRFDRAGRRGSLTQHGLWNGSTRIQVKSVNVLTGEAQPTVSASTPFTHQVAAASKADAKEMIAANLLQQIARARVVNPALFSVLSAARHNLSGVSQHSTQPQHPRPDEDAILWLQTASAGPLAPISAPAAYGAAPNAASVAAPLPPMDMSLLTSHASLFSMHTPVPGHAFSGISAIGLQTPSGSQQHTPQQANTYELPALMRSVSEALNEESERTSKASAECALEDSPEK